MSAEIEADAKREHRKTKKKGGDAGETISVRKSKKEKNEEKDMTAEPNEDSKSSEKQEKKRKRKHREAVNIDDDTAQNPGGSDVTEKTRLKRQKKRKDEDVSSAATAVKATDDAKHQKSKKKSKKHKHDNIEQKDEGGSDVDRDTARRKKKDERKKSKKEREKGDVDTSLQKPSEDEALTDKARAALSYAYTRIASPDTWKFNKAHQNWIVRHFFSLDDVPEKYIPMAVNYLEGCQGGIREKLVQSCKAQLEPSALNSESPTTRISSEATPNEPIEMPAGTAPTDSTSLTLEKKKSTLSPEIHEAVKARARLLFKALRIGSS